MTMDQNGNFRGKVAFVVTGAAGGIGRATALAFAREGASVVVTDVSEQDNQETARMIEESGGRALAIRSGGIACRNASPWSSSGGSKTARTLSPSM